MVRDPQCKVWQRRRTALRKPQHGAQKTGGGAQLRRTKSRAAVGAKGDSVATGSNATALGGKSRSDPSTAAKAAAAESARKKQKSPVPPTDSE